MSTISVKDVQRDFLAFLRRIEAGETLIVVRDDQPLAEIRPLKPSTNGARPFGLSKGQFTVPSDFDQPLPDDVLRNFEGQ